MEQLDSNEDFSEDKLLLGYETLTEKKKRLKDAKKNSLNEIEGDSCQELKKDNTK